jgi:serpin B
MEHMVNYHGADAEPLPLNYTPVDLWIENKTDGMIKELMGGGDLDPMTKALLVDAVFFKGTWRIEFDPKENAKGTFVYRDGSENDDVTFMKASRMMEASTSPSLGNARFVVLEYKGSEFVAVFILPATPDNESMDNVVTGLYSQSLLDLIDEAIEMPVELKLPRFKLEFGPLSLKPSLMNMGMVEAFGDGVGKFNRMSFDPTLYVEDFVHGACMEVNEEGTEAAGATAIVMNYRSVRDESMKLVFNRPFVVALFQLSTGIPLFIGRVEQPDFT